ncbi:hypothetical protein EDB83DRAFT_36320 [Lactarius deliciosus]|nr:hypothetical protein EDB83DRAFT_36320 [Lactarius deliciosus]
MRPVPPYLIPQFIPPQLFVHRLWLCVWALQNIATEDWDSNLHRSKDWGELLGSCACRTSVTAATCSRLNSSWPQSAPARSRYATPRDSSLSVLSRPTSDWKDYNDAPCTRHLLVLLLQQIFPRCVITLLMRPSCTSSTSS